MTNYDITAHYDGKLTIHDIATSRPNIESALKFILDNLPPGATSISVTVAP